MKWFKHISDSLDDPFVHDLMHKWGAKGYTVFFGTLEIYAREFSPEIGWKLSLSWRYLKTKLCVFHLKVLTKIMDYIAKSGRFVFDEGSLEGDNFTLFIPKFRELLDDTTLKKLRRNSGALPKKCTLDIDKEGDKEEEGDKLRILLRSKNRDFFKAYPKQLGKFEFWVSSALKDGWTAQEIETHIYKTAGKLQEIKPWEWLKKQNSSKLPKFEPPQEAIESVPMPEQVKEMLSNIGREI